MATEEQPVVTYTVQDIVERIDRSLTEVKTMIQTKADESDLITLRSKMQEMDARLAVAETNLSNRKWLLASIILPTVSVVIAALALVAYKF